MSTFAYAGVSKLKGEFKVRFANDQMRVKVLAKNGHSDIDIIELKTPLTKEEAVAFLISIDFDNGNKIIRAALEAEVDKRQPTAPKAPKTVAAKPTMESIKAKVAAKKPPVSTKSKAQIEAELADLDDAPF